MKSKVFGRYILGLIVVSSTFSCFKSSPSTPYIPSRNDYVPPTYTPSDTQSVGLPAGTTPISMIMAGLSADEANNGQVLISVGKIKQFSVDILLEDQQKKKQSLRGYYAVNWTISNPDIGTINNKGVFTPLKEGRAKITGSINGVAAQIEVNVTSALNIWSQVISPTSKDLYATKLVNDNEGWAVGQGGTILHYINGGWIDESSSVSSSLSTSSIDFTGIDATAESGDAWAVGGNVILHYSGGKWDKSNFTADGTIRAIDMLSQTEGWAVGITSNNKGMVLKYSNGSWQDVSGDIKEELNTVSVVGQNQVWVGGKSRLLGAPAMYNFNGDKWTKARFNKDTIISNLLSKVTPWDGTYDIKSIKMINSSQGWAVGESSPIGETIRGKRGFMFYYDSIKEIWIKGTVDKSTPDLEQVPLKNVGMLSGGKGWVLGSNTPPKKLFQKEVSDIPGNFLECDGKSIKIDTKYQANTVGKAFHGIDILPNGNGIVVGESGFIMQHQYDVSRPNYYSSGNTSNSSSNYATPSNNTQNNGQSNGSNNY
ncbi:MAG: Ig-like domain-containing protein [Cyanobacteriota bacterium]